MEKEKHPAVFVNNFTCLPIPKLKLDQDRLKTKRLMSNYYKTKESVDEYCMLAKDSDGRLLIDKLGTFLASGSSLLEIGCGPGTDWKILQKKYKVVGSDSSPEFLKRLQNSNPDGEFIKLDARTLKTDKIFDGIYSNKVLHHLSDTELQSSLKRQAEILAPGGIVCHSFWKGVGHETYNGLFVNYHTKRTLTDFFKKYFDILITDEYQEFEDGDSIIIVGRKESLG